MYSSYRKWIHLKILRDTERMGIDNLGFNMNDFGRIEILNVRGSDLVFS